MFPCPCCGYLIFDEPPGSYDICPICFWEDNIVQLRFPEMGGGPNKISLIESQKNFAAMGACEERLCKHTRRPRAGETRDPSWRPIDPQRDQFEAYPSDKSHFDLIVEGWREDSARLYYWRR